MGGFKPFFVQLPCCGLHDNDAMGGVKTYPIHEANVLVLSGVVTHAAWVLIQEIYEQMDKPRWLVSLGAPNEGLYDAAFVPRLGLVPHVRVNACPVTKNVVDEAFRLLVGYAKKNT